MENEPYADTSISSEQLRSQVGRAQAQRDELYSQLIHMTDNFYRALEEKKEWEQRFIDLAMSLGKDYKLEKDDHAAA